MTNEASEPDIAKIRQLLLAAFSVKELRRFCFDDPIFRPITDEFAPDHGLADLVDLVLGYCDRNLLIEELLEAVERANPRQYAHFFGPGPSAPEILTISSPIELELVRVPAGEFQMGSDTDTHKDARDDEQPVHTVHVPEFHIGRYPVTNGQYSAFVQANAFRAPNHWRKGVIPKGKANHPVVNVLWSEADLFCAWLRGQTNRPFRLPTEAEWEKAARGTDGRIYPWGDEPPDESRCNFDKKVGDTTAIGRYSPQGDSPYGCADMAGNVSEWCRSLYKAYPYQAKDGREVEVAGNRVLRGGAFFNSGVDVRCSCRYWSHPLQWFDFVGFRVVLTSDPRDLNPGL